jgi:ABC-2 type transport system permease protein
VSTALRPYRAVLAARFRLLLQYRAAALVGVITQLFWGALRIMVLVAFVASSTQRSPMSIEQLVAYVWLGQALLVLVPWSIDNELAEQVRSGGVAFELVRPVDLYWMWFARTLAFRTARASLRCTPILVLAMAVFPFIGLERWALPLPPTPGAGALFLCSLFGLVLLSTAITMLLHVNLLHALTGLGANQIMPSLVFLLSGLTVPLPFYPDWLQPFLQLQPLRGLGDVPYRIYTGHIGLAAGVRDVLQQLAWSAALIALGRWLLARATRRIVVQGG